MILHLKVQLPAVVVHGGLPAQADILRPLDPRLALKAVFHRHEQGEIVQPPLVFLAERRKRFVVADVAAGVGQPQQTAALGVQAAVVDVVCLAAKVCLFAFGGGQNSFFHQCVQTDEIWVARKGGKALIRAVAVAGHPQRQDLPVGLSGLLEPIHKIVCFLREAADAVRGRQTADGQQNACTSLHLHVPSFYNSIRTPAWSETCGSRRPLNTTRLLFTGTALEHQIWSMRFLASASGASRQPSMACTTV